MNDTLSAIAKRYSCRDFLEKLPPDDLLNAVAAAAVQSPSAMNAQPWRIIIVTNKNLIKEMDEEGLRIVSEWDDKSMYQRLKSRGGAISCGAPCMMIIPMAKGTGMDCGIVCQSIAIAAASLGLDSLICWQAGIALSGSKGSYFIKKLDFPENYEFGIAVLIGYGKNPGKAHEPDMSKISRIK